MCCWYRMCLWETRDCVWSTSACGCTGTFCLVLWSFCGVPLWWLWKEFSLTRHPQEKFRLSHDASVGLKAGYSDRIPNVLHEFPKWKMLASGFWTMLTTLHKRLVLKWKQDRTQLCLIFWYHSCSLQLKKPESSNMNTLMQDPLSDRRRGNSKTDSLCYNHSMHWMYVCIERIELHSKTIVVSFQWSAFSHLNLSHWTRYHNHLSFCLWLRFNIIVTIRNVVLIMHGWILIVHKAPR